LYAAPRLSVVCDQRKAATQLDHGGQLAALPQGVADSCGGRIVDGKHSVSMGSSMARSKQPSGRCSTGFSPCGTSRSRLGRRHGANVAQPQRPGAGPTPIGLCPDGAPLTAREQLHQVAARIASAQGFHPVSTAGQRIFLCVALGFRDHFRARVSTAFASSSTLQARGSKDPPIHSVSSS
jgi:hypothetical protein